MRSRLASLTLFTICLLPRAGNATGVTAEADMTMSATGSGYATYRGLHTGLIFGVSPQHQNLPWSIRGVIYQCPFQEQQLCGKSGVASATPSLICESQKDLWCESGTEKYKPFTATLLSDGSEVSDQDEGPCVRHDCPAAPPAPGPEDPSPTDPCPCPNSPILIDLLGDGFSLTSLENGVRFDLNGDGWRERRSWTRAGSDDAFLVLDRNGNGQVDSGLELFGDATAQPPVEEPNGFLALSVFDGPVEGGNGDRRITAADSVFHALRLWVDSNHDGLSRPAELLSLTELQVAAIDLDYIETRRRDRHGNEYRYLSKVHLRGRRHRVQSVDVFLLSAD
jgi:hypothetical protein